MKTERIFSTILVIFFISFAVQGAYAASNLPVKVVKRNGRWWFSDDGKLFLSKGVVGVRYRNGVNSTYENLIHGDGVSTKVWLKEVADKLYSWGFNTIGPWSDDGFCKSNLYMAPNLSISASLINRGSSLRKFPDVFSKDFEDRARKIVNKAYLKYKNCHLLGFFSDNELDWSIDMLDRYLSLTQGSPGKVAADRFLRAHKGESHVKVRREFLALVADKYFSTIKSAIESLPEKVLYLGSRFGWPKRFSMIAVREAGKYVDVLSFQTYPRSFPIALARKIFDASRRPMLWSEFSVRAKDSDLPNTKGGGLLVATQHERGLWYRKFVCKAVSQPFIVGYHWFRWVDDPKHGRFDGENSNHGLINAHAIPYKNFISSVKMQDDNCP